MTDQMAEIHIGELDAGETKGWNWDILRQRLEEDVSSYQGIYLGRMIAFLSGHHPRCGALSPLMDLSPDILRWIVEILGGEEIWCEASTNYPFLRRQVRCLVARRKVTSILALGYISGLPFDPTANFIYHDPVDNFTASVLLYAIPDSRAVIRFWWTEETDHHYEIGYTFHHREGSLARFASSRSLPISKYETVEMSDQGIIEGWGYRRETLWVMTDALLQTFSDWTNFLSTNHYWSEIPTRLPTTPIRVLFDRAFSAYEAGKRIEK